MLGKVVKITIEIITCDLLEIRWSGDGNIRMTYKSSRMYKVLCFSALNWNKIVENSGPIRGSISLYCIL